MTNILRYRLEARRLLEKGMFYYLGLYLCGLTNFVRYTLEISTTPFSLLAYALLGFKIICTDYRPRDILIGAVLLFAGGMNALNTGDTTWVINALTIIALKDVPMEAVLRQMFWGALLAFVLVAGSSLLGYTEIVMVKDYGRGAVEIRYTLGFGQPNQLHLYVFRLMALGVGAYFEKIKWYHIAVLFVLNLVVFHFTVSRTGLIMVFGLLLLWMIYHCCWKITESHPWKAVVFVGTVGLIFLQIWVMYNYNEFSFLQKINELLTGRLSIASRALEELKDQISLWGIADTGEYSIDYTMTYMLVFKGIVLTALYWLMVVLCLGKALKENKTYLIIVTILFAVYAVCEHSAIDRIGRNICMLYFAWMLFDVGEQSIETI